MKKLFLSILVGLSFLLMPVMAQENEELPDPGITPDSIFYGLDKAFERLQLALTFNHTEKAKLHLKFAGERLSEIKIMINEKKEKHINKILEDYEEELNKTNEEIKKSRGIGQNVSAIVKQINVSTEKHIAVLNLVLQKVPEQAKPAIQRAIDNSKKIKSEVKNETEFEDEEEKEEVICGGIAGIKCPEEYECKYENLCYDEEGNIIVPDCSGTCKEKKEPNNKKNNRKNKTNENETENETEDFDDMMQ